MHDEILYKKLYDRLSNDEKDRFHSFLSIAELYINSLKINQKFDNEITFDWEKKPENYNNLEKINEFLNSNFKKEFIYNNAEQGHPSTKEVYIYTKDDKKLFYFSEVKYYGDYEIVTIKYNDDLKAVFLNIGGASYNHLRGFSNGLKNNNFTSTVDFSKYLSQEEVNTKWSLKNKLLENLEWQWIVFSETIKANLENCAQNDEKNHEEIWQWNGQGKWQWKWNGMWKNWQWRWMHNFQE